MNVLVWLEIVWKYSELYKSIRDRIKAQKTT